MTHRAPHHSGVAPVGGWDRLAIVALGAAGCALSYDALQQMAVAIHVRGHLTYLFPLVIDGFIAYGVRAILVLAGAPLRARLYIWLLFATATAASIWANALHAVRLNQQAPSGGGLHLGDTVVATLSTIAPLALAGAVHLYILITRHHPGPTPAPTPDRPPHRDHNSPVPGPRIATPQDHRATSIADFGTGPHAERGPSGTSNRDHRCTAGPRRGPRSGPRYRPRSPPPPGSDQDREPGTSDRNRHCAPGPVPGNGPQC
jgi:hypothetical protein